MKMIMLAVTITPHSAAVDEVLAALRFFGEVDVVFQGEVDLVQSPDDFDAVWLRAPQDEGESWLQVNKPGWGWEKIKELSEEEVKKFTSCGVCVAFTARYPRADKYGTPLYASDRMFAMGIIGEEGFAVTGDVQISSEDSGDDSYEEMFFKIAIPNIQE